MKMRKQSPAFHSTIHTPGTYVAWPNPVSLTNIRLGKSMLHVQKTYKTKAQTYHCSLRNFMNVVTHEKMFML